MLGAKRRRSGVSPLNVIRLAREIELDMSKVMPTHIYEWMSVVSKSRNTSTEFLLLACLPATAALMGPSSEVRVRSTYSEPLNLFGIVLSPPGAGKSQAFDLAVTSPFSQLDDPPPSIVVGDHTRSGLARHLTDNNGIALIGTDELGIFLESLCSKKRDGLEERAFLNKLYDRREDMGPYTYEYGNTRLVINSSRVCISGFSQDEEFVKQFIDMSVRKDGFVDRLLFAVPPAQLLRNAEVDEWASKLNNYPICDLNDVYQEIWELHTSAPANCAYILTQEARDEYNLYSDNLIRQLNCKFSSSNESEDEDVEDVSSKDGRTVLRLAGALHVLYNVIDRALKDVNFRQEYKELPESISLETMKYAIALTDYYRSQRSVFLEAAKGNIGEKSLSVAALKSKIMCHPGPCVTVRNVSRSVPSSRRPDASKVTEAMNGLEEERAGVVVDGPQRVKVFLKRKRIDIEADEQARNYVFKTLITADLYEENFKIRDPKLPDKLFIHLLKSHPNEHELLEQFNLSDQ